MSQERRRAAPRPNLGKADLRPSSAGGSGASDGFSDRSRPVVALNTLALIEEAVAILERHPAIGRAVEQGSRELVISRGSTEIGRADLPGSKHYWNNNLLEDTTESAFVNIN